jgi:hypothetical protein
LSPQRRRRRRVDRSWSARLIEALEERALLDGSGDLLMALETSRVMALVPDGSFQDIAVKTGDWSNPATWQGGVVPRNMDNVLISPGVTVTISGDLAKDDGGNRVAIHALRVDGTLAFDTSGLSQNPNALRCLLVDTIIVSPPSTSDPTGGTFQMGTPTSPIPSGGQAEVIFADNGPVNAPANTDSALSTLWPDGDPYEFSRGLIVMGNVTIDGTEVTSEEPVQPGPTGETYLGPTSSASPPVTTIALAGTPTNWQVGDHLVITGDTAATSNSTNQDEQATITRIGTNPATGVTEVTISVPLQYLHYAPAGASIYVSDTSRNAIFTSENTAQIPDRGHIMFMHTSGVQVDAAGFYGLGRTDKSTPINDPTPVIDPNNPGKPSHPNYTDTVNGAQTGTNPRGRYAVHFHHDDMMDAGGSGMQGLDTINDSAVVDSPGWGIVNHSSNVDVTNNVVYGATGAAFVTEAGDETGIFDHNIAIHSKGASGGAIGNPTFARPTDIQDFGSEGVGFWFQGGNVSVTNNIATGSQRSGYYFLSLGLIQKLPVSVGPDGKDVFQNVLTTIPASELTWASWAPADPTATVQVRDVPLKQFSGNVAFANGDGLEIWGSLTSNTYPGAVDNIDNFKVYGSPTQAIDTSYSGHIAFHDDTLLGDLSKPPAVNSFGIDGVNQDTFTFDHVDVRGYDIGIRGPYIGTSSISGCTFQDLRAIYITPDNANNQRVINIAGDNTFLALPSGDLGGQTQYEIDLQPTIDFTRPNIVTSVFNPANFYSTLGTVTYNGQQLYYDEQAASFVPYPAATAPAGISPALIGQTNTQLMSSYGLAVGGFLAPADAVTNPGRIHGVVGGASTAQVALYLNSPADVNLDPTQPPSYQLSYRYLDPATRSWVTITEPAPTQLGPGWNLLSRNVTIDGVTSLRTFLVHNDFIALRLDPIADQAMAANGSLTITLGGHDLPGSQLTYSATATITSTTSPATTSNPLYNLKQQLGLWIEVPSLYNSLGQHEKWLRGTWTSEYYILPDGEFWNGEYGGHAFITNVGTDVYNNTALLLNAQVYSIGLSITGDQLTITPTPGFTGTFVVDVTVSDGTAAVKRSFTVTVS